MEQFLLMVHGFCSSMLSMKHSPCKKRLPLVEDSTVSRSEELYPLTEFVICTVLDSEGYPNHARSWKQSRVSLNMVSIWIWDHGGIPGGHYADEENGNPPLNVCCLENPSGSPWFCSDSPRAGPDDSSKAYPNGYIW